MASTNLLQCIVPAYFLLEPSQEAKTLCLIARHTGDHARMVLSKVVSKFFFLALMHPRWRRKNPRWRLIGPSPPSWAVGFLPPSWAVGFLPPS